MKEYLIEDWSVSEDEFIIVGALVARTPEEALARWRASKIGTANFIALNPRAVEVTRVEA